VFAGRVTEQDRRTLEDGFVAALSACGVRATTSDMLFKQTEVPPDANAIRAALRSRGYDGALVLTMKGVTDGALVAPDIDWAAGGFYEAYWGPGALAYTESDPFVKFETTLWSASTGKMVWSAVTQTRNPTSKADFVSSLAKAVVPSLATAGLIPSTHGEPVSSLR